MIWHGYWRTTMDFVRKRKLSSTGNQLDPCSKQKIKSLFDKKFRYGISGDWKLPPLVQNDCQKWVHPVLQGMKEELNKVKDKLSDKEIYAWHEHTKFMNIAGNVISNVKQIIRPELCTQAWCKFYEILSSYPLINHESLKLNTVHLCEAPGAFVTSLNHYLVSNGKYIIISCRFLLLWWIIQFISWIFGWLALASNVLFIWKQECNMCMQYLHKKIF